jgi:hypothetical protein
MTTAPAVPEVRGATGWARTFDELLGGVGANDSGA